MDSKYGPPSANTLAQSGRAEPSTSVGGGGAGRLLSHRPHTGHVNREPDPAAAPNTTHVGTDTADPQSLDLNLEFADRLKESEITLSFRCFSQTKFFVGSKRHHPHRVESIRLSFNFFNRPAFVSSRVVLGADPQYESTHKDDGVPLISNDQYVHQRFLIDYKVAIKPNQHRFLIEYLYLRDLTIDVWDADTLFHIGSATLSLCQLLRQGREHVYIEDHVLDVRESPASTGGWTTGGNQPTGSAATAAGSANSLVERGFDEQQRGAHRGKLIVTMSNSGSAALPTEETELNASIWKSIPSVTSAAERVARTTMLTTNPHGAVVAINPSGTAPAGSGGAAGLNTTATVDEMFEVSKAKVLATSFQDSVHIALNTSGATPYKKRAALLEDENPQLREQLSGVQALTGVSDSRVPNINSLELMVGRDLRQQKTVGSSGGGGSAGVAFAESKARSFTKRAGGGGGGGGRSGGSGHRTRLAPIKKIHPEKRPAQQQEIIAVEKPVMAKNLKVLERYRNELNDSVTIPRLLSQMITQTRFIYPSYAQLVFFELAFTNPYNDKSSFYIRINDPLIPTGVDGK